MKDDVFEYPITVLEEDFNLELRIMRTPEGVFKATFDI